MKTLQELVQLVQLLDGIVQIVLHLSHYMRR